MGLLDALMGYAPDMPVMRVRGDFALLGLRSRHVLR